MTIHFPPLNALKATATLVLLSFLLTSCFDSNDGRGTERFLYTSTNNPNGNGVILLTIERNGDISTAAATAPPFATGTSQNAAGDADDDDFDSQGALHIIGDYLLVVNAGEQSGTDYRSGETTTNPRTISNGSISVMKINRRDGSLTLMGDPVSSMGVRPVSITSAEIGGARWVIVANQYDNPYCQAATGGGYECGCRFLSGSVQCGTPVAATDLRNLAAFIFRNGELRFRGILDIKTPGDPEGFRAGEQGGVAQVSFSPDNRKLAVSTWGVPLIPSYTASDLTAARTAGFRESGTKVWDIAATQSTLTLSRYREWTKPGVSGSIGFQWAPNNRHIYLTSFSVPSNGNNYGVVVLDSQGGSETAPTLVDTDWSGTRYRLGSTMTRQEDTVNTIVEGSVTRPDHACWAWLSSNGRHLYTASFNTNIVSFFDVTQAGDEFNLTQAYSRKNPDPSQGAPIPNGDTKDLFIPRDGSFLYVVGAFRSHTISYYAISGNGRLSEADNSPFIIYRTNNPLSNQEAFLGLIGY